MNNEILDKKINHVCDDISNIKISISEIFDKLNEINTITIMNGRGKRRPYLRKDFFQELWDKAEYWKSTKVWIKDILLILTVLTMFLKIFKVI